MQVVSADDRDTAARGPTILSARLKGVDVEDVDIAAVPTAEQGEPVNVDIEIEIAGATGGNARLPIPLGRFVCPDDFDRRVTQPKRDSGTQLLIKPPLEVSSRSFNPRCIRGADLTARRHQVDQP